MILFNEYQSFKSVYILLKYKPFIHSLQLSFQYDWSINGVIAGFYCAAFSYVSTSWKLKPISADTILYLTQSKDVFGKYSGNRIQIESEQNS